MTILEILSLIFILSGSVFMLISAVGLIRLPDFYIRNSASTKAATLGLGLILAGTALFFNQIMVFIEIFAIFLFVFMIAPLAAHIVARAAFKDNIPFWKKTNLVEIAKDMEDFDNDSDQKNS
ncbi:MAG: monovalent cation/H(+) antiporter subunit G [Cyclobacteriaceae bacterium]